MTGQPGGVWLVGCGFEISIGYTGYLHHLLYLLMCVLLDSLMCVPATWFIGVEWNVYMALL